MAKKSTSRKPSASKSRSKMTVGTVSPLFQTDRQESSILSTASRVFRRRSPIGGFAFSWSCTEFGSWCFRPEGQTHPLPGPSGPGNAWRSNLRPERPAQLSTRYTHPRNSCIGLSGLESYNRINPGPDDPGIGCVCPPGLSRNRFVDQAAERIGVATYQNALPDETQLRRRLEQFPQLLENDQ